jgi:hypothetical protein
MNWRRRIERLPRTGPAHNVAPSGGAPEIYRPNARFGFPDLKAAPNDVLVNVHRTSTEAMSALS